MPIFMELAIVLVAGVLIGSLMHFIKLPRLISYLIIGILMSPSVFSLITPEMDAISSILRQIALVIILTRSGLSLDIGVLKSIGRPAILLAFVPATFEIVGIMIFGPMILGLSYVEALLLGSVLAAVSPAVVVPRMIKFQDEGYSRDKHLPELVMAGASCDDIYVILLFYVFKSIVSSGTFQFLDVVMLPVGIVIGIASGLVFGIIFLLITKWLKLNDVLGMALMLGLSFLLLFIENILKPYVSLSALLGIIAMAMLVFVKNKGFAGEIKKGYNSMWVVFEMLLFALVGAKVDLSYAFSINGLLCIAVLFVGLAFRSLGTFLSILGKGYTWKEKWFVIISYLPKATVQASIGAIALSEGLSCGTVILTAAIISILITAPLGSVLIDKLTPKLLEKQ